MSDSSLLELLSVTDKAVKALNKSHSSCSNQSSVASVKSNGSHTKDSGIKTQTEHVDGNTSDISAVSTTASDVLIKSTVLESEDKQHHSSSSGGGANGSNESKCSRTSIGVDNFNSSGPQKIKISTKKLREIRSPLEGDFISPRLDTSSPPVITQTNSQAKKSNIREPPLVTRHMKNTVNDQIEKTSPRDSLPKKHENIPERLVQKASFPSAKHGKYHSDNEFSSNKAEDPSHDKSSLGVKIQNGSIESSDETSGHVYKQNSDKSRSDDRDIVVERHTPKITRPSTKRLVDDDEDKKIKRKLMELDDIIDLIPQKDKGNVTTVSHPENNTFFFTVTDAEFQIVN